MKRPQNSLGIGEGQVLPITPRYKSGSKRRKVKYAIGFIVAYLVGYTTYDVYRRTTAPVPTAESAHSSDYSEAKKTLMETKE